MLNILHARHTYYIDFSFVRVNLIIVVVVGHKARTRAGLANMSEHHAARLQASLVA